MIVAVFKLYFFMNDLILKWAFTEENMSCIHKYSFIHLLPHVGQAKKNNMYVDDLMKLSRVLNAALCFKCNIGYASQSLFMIIVTKK